MRRGGRGQARPGRRPTRAERERPRRPPGVSPGSSARHSAASSHSASSPSEAISSCRRRSSAASSRSSATCSAPVSRYPGSIPLASLSSAANSGHEACEASAAASSRSSPQVASPTGASMPAATPEAPAPGSSRSRTSTRSPRCAARQAQARPIAPAPTINASGLESRTRYLRRHYPVQVQTVGGQLPPSQPLGWAPVGYRCYSAILPALWIRAQRLERLRHARLYFVCEGRPRAGDPEPLLRAALRGGVDMIQLREKAPRCADEIVALAEPFRRAADEHGRPVPHQRPPGAGRGVRRRRRPRRPGRRAGRRGARRGRRRRAGRPLDALGGTVRRRGRRPRVTPGPTRSAPGRSGRRPTKEGRPAAGLGLIEHAAAHGGDANWFAIGGIDAGNVDEVVAAGARRAVVVRAIRDAADPEGSARELREALDG